MGHIKKSQEQFIKEVSELHPTLLLDKIKYATGHTKVWLGCRIHGYFQIQASNLLHQGKGCKHCNGIERGNKLRKSQSQFVQELNKLPKKYNLEKLNYTGAHQKVTIGCIIHGYFQIKPSHLLRGHDCKKCNLEKLKIRKLTNPLDFIELAKKLHPTLNFDNTNYTRASSKVEYYCNIHKKNFTARASSLLRGSGCPMCSESKGEKIISEFLTGHNIDFTPQMKFKTCRNKRVLPFDFYLNDYNILIEYDGKQHYESVKIWGGDREYNNTKIKDNIKTIWAEANRIPLLRIKYTDIKNITGILCNFLELD